MSIILEAISIFIRQTQTHVIVGIASAISSTHMQYIEKK